MRILALILLISLSVAPQKSQAEVIATDLETAGDGLLTYDTINKREWLDLPETGSVRLAEVLTQMEPGGRLAGFQFATLEDVSALAESAGVTWDWKAGPNSLELIELLGATITATGGILGDVKWTNGLIATGFANGYPLFDDTNVYISSNYHEPPPGGVTNPIFDHGGGSAYTDGPVQWPDGLTFGIGDIGPFWLYRAVPEPGTATMLLVASVTMLTCKSRNIWEH